jgi:hypothetical protein
MKKDTKIYPAPAETGDTLKEDFQIMIANLPLQMTYEDAAFLCGCSKSQIQRGILAGQIKVGKTPAGKGKRSKRVITSSLLDWVAQYA